MTTSARSIVTVLTVAVALALWAVIPLIGSFASVDDGFVIDRFDREVVVQPDGSVDVTETIEVTFLEERRGIFRDLEGTGIDGRAASYEVRSVDRGTDGDPWTYVVEDEDGAARVRIGDADVELDPGPQTYRLQYGATGQVARDDADPDTVEVRIDVPGIEWPVAVAETTLTVQLPTAPGEVACVVGAEGEVEPCPETSVDDTTVTQQLGPLEPRTTGTVSVRLPGLAFDMAAVPDATLTPLEQGDADPPPRLELPRPLRGWLVGLVAALPILAFEGLRSRIVYRDQVTDPSLHDRPVPTAELAPPDGLPPADLAAVLQRPSLGDDPFLATLIDLEQRGVLVSEAVTEDGTRVGPDDDAEVEVVTIRSGSDTERTRPFERAFVGALFGDTGGVVLDGEYDEDVAKRVTAAQKVLTDRATELRRPGAGLVHDAGGWLRGARGALVGFVTVVVATGLGLAAARLAGLSVPATLLVLAVTLLAWSGLALAWRYHRQAFTSEGRHLSARTRAYRHFLTEVHRDQLDFGAQQGVHHLHPAVALLPYAVVLGLGDSWYQRFGVVLAELSARAPAEATATVPWWGYAGGYHAFQATRSGTVTDASASSGGGGAGGGAGSGGGGGGGGSW